jgi:hypothetical protein
LQFFHRFNVTRWQVLRYRPGDYRLKVGRFERVQLASLQLFRRGLVGLVNLFAMRGTARRFWSGRALSARPLSQRMKPTTARHKTLMWLTGIKDTPLTIGYTMGLDPDSVLLLLVGSGHRIASLPLN